MSTGLFRSELDEVLDDERPRPTSQPAPGRTAITSKLATFGVRVARRADPARGGARDADGVAAGAELAVARAAGASGAALPVDVRRRFEASLGADLSAVRIHTGADSAAAAAAVGAHAYTVGHDIHFAAGRYQPDDPFGLHLLAHEVAHTVQQAEGPSDRQHRLEVSTSADGAEAEADRAADAMVAGRPAEVSGSAARIARTPDPAANVAGPADPSSGATAQGGGVKVTVVAPVKAANAIEFDAVDYAELYRQVSARAASSKCAGQCDCGAIGCNYVTSGTKVVEATFTTEIRTSVPTWKQYATQPKPHQAKFDAWVASVKVHEAEHVRIYTEGLAKLKTQVIGPGETDCDTQSDAVVAAIQTLQDAFDADKSRQPAPLPIPGGTSRIGPDGKETPVSPNDTSAGIDGDPDS